MSTGSKPSSFAPMVLRRAILRPMWGGLYRMLHTNFGENLFSWTLAIHAA
jgi:hypothetical protein